MAFEPDYSVTIAIPTRNGGEYLAETVRSLLAQTYTDFRLFVLDDHSEDDSVAALRAMPDGRLAVVEAAERHTMVGNWNRAFDLPKTPVLVVAHNDDLYEPDYLGNAVKLLESHPSAFMAHCRARMIDAQGRDFDAAFGRYKDRFWPQGPAYERSIAEELGWLLGGNYIIAPSVAFRTDATDRIGRFDESYQFVTDWEYWFRGLLAGFTITGLRRPLVRWRRHPGTATTAHEKALSRYREEIRLLDAVTREAHDRGLVDRESADYKLVHRTVATEFANRLQAGDSAGATALLDFAVTEVPGFKRSAMHAVLAIAQGFGAAGGRLLKALERRYVDLTAPRE